MMRYRHLLQGNNGPGVVVDVKGVLRDALHCATPLYWSL
ncbi:hypothetical protein MELA_01136 [Candidatus Methylomirabilis lanthanidiphila]|uniref:Uncharacterized protein n=1 Tax=Candidatus Methylomirabilis lanthanidiphila TaxID=2211376 RepID=A0A564ZJE1_9BACT|nr:hypothetical protein MELA_01136 [Candidatus Methylomirabilis lanthanidiphila]